MRVCDFTKTLINFPIQSDWYQVLVFLTDKAGDKINTGDRNDSRTKSCQNIQKETATVYTMAFSY